MAQFPTREADVAALAGTIVNGLTEYAEEFPACPVSVETLREVLSAYNTANDAAAIAQAAASDAFGVKEEAMRLLTDRMKDVLRYAETVGRHDERKLKLIGWRGRRDASTVEPHGIEIEYQVIAIDKAGDSLPSNLITVVL